MRVSEREQQLLTFISQQGAITYSTLALILGYARQSTPLVSESKVGPSSLRNVQRVVRRLRSLGLIESWTPINDLGPLIVATPDGSHLAGFEKAVPRPRVGTIAHTIQVAHLRAQFEASGKIKPTLPPSIQGTVVSDRSLPLWVAQSGLWRFGLQSRGPRADHWPDSALVRSTHQGVTGNFDTQAAVAIEVERTLKGTTRYAKILRQLAGNWHQVLYVSTDQKILDTVERVANESLAEEDAKRFGFMVMQQPQKLAVKGH